MLVYSNVSFNLMHSFKNQKIQELYDYLIDDFDANGLYYDEKNTIEEVKSHIDNFNPKDWIDFELTISQWDSGILCLLANLITYDNSPKYSYEKIYCLAFINCDYTDSYELLNGLSMELNQNKVLEEKLLIKVIKRAYEFWDGYTAEHIEFTKKLLKEKLKLTRSISNAG